MLTAHEAPSASTALRLGFAILASGLIALTVYLAPTGNGAGSARSVKPPAVAPVVLLPIATPPERATSRQHRSRRSDLRPVVDTWSAPPRRTQAETPDDDGERRRKRRKVPTHGRGPALSLPRGAVPPIPRSEPSRRIRRPVPQRY
jgi:hypothetical protein